MEDIGYDISLAHQDWSFSNFFTYVRLFAFVFLHSFGIPVWW